LAQQLEAEGVDAIFINPIRTGGWTTGVASMPELEQQRAVLKNQECFLNTWMIF
jgi:hypothetical protein